MSRRSWCSSCRTRGRLRALGREIERAVSKRHPVVALRIDAAPLTAAFEYFLNQSQWIEGGGSDAAIEQLVTAVGQHLFAW